MVTFRYASIAILIISAMTMCHSITHFSCILQVRFLLSPPVLMTRKKSQLKNYYIQGSEISPDYKGLIKGTPQKNNNYTLDRKIVFSQKQVVPSCKPAKHGGYILVQLVISQKYFCKQMYISATCCLRKSRRAHVNVKLHVFRHVSPATGITQKPLQIFTNKKLVSCRTPL